MWQNKVIKILGTVHIYIVCKFITFEVNLHTTNTSVVPPTIHSLNSGRRLSQPPKLACLSSSKYCRHGCLDMCSSLKSSKKTCANCSFDNIVAIIEWKNTCALKLKLYSKPVQCSVTRRDTLLRVCCKYILGA